jgi:outer membrane protein OmpA-like peptidoglycan-associated protein
VKIVPAPFLKSKKRIAAKEEHWIPLSDLMTGLMMMFMLVAIVFMVKVDSEAAVTKELKKQAEEQADRMKSVAVIYEDMRNNLYHRLQQEFRNDLQRWKAELDGDLTIRFREPDVLFDSGRFDLKAPFQAILSDFFPRYVHILASPEFRDSIVEVRIEGHTSSFWKDTSAEQAYFKNMELSQARTRATLEFLLTKTRLFGFERWVKSKLTANGLSSSRPQLKSDGSEDREASQRVEFRVLTNADERLAEVLSASTK